MSIATRIFESSEEDELFSMAKVAIEVCREYYNDTGRCLLCSGHEHEEWCYIYGETV